jgi:2-dehydropantoate 2-reductase
VEVRIAVVGSGAMGSLFGAFLAESGNDVVLVDVWREHIDAINRFGLKVSGVSGERIVRVKATTNHSEVGLVDLVILFVKSYDTEQAIRDSLTMISDETVVLTCQNGVGNVERIGEVIGISHVICGATMQGATLVRPGEIFHAGSGITYIGELDGSVSERIKKIEAIFNNAGIRTEISRNIYGMIWSKLLINAGINPFGALTRLRNGELLEVPGMLELMTQAVNEGVEVAKALGIKLEIGDPVEALINTCRATAKNKNSMLQDIERGRRTEIDVINGAIVKYGRKVGVKTPVNELLTTLIRGLEKSISVG